MDMAPAAAEVAVVTGAVMQGACVQQYAAAAAWVRQASSMRWWSHRRQRTGAQLQWMAGSQRACGSKQRMGGACNSMQRNGVCTTACSGSSVCVAAGGSSQQHNCNG